MNRMNSAVVGGLGASRVACAFHLWVEMINQGCQQVPFVIYCEK